MTWKTANFIESLKKPVLVIGAGGIGCELLKNLCITGFTNIHVIDLDTIDISNLNRQFLFRKEHVGKSKSEVATAAVKTMMPGIDITFDHGSVTSEKYDVDFFKKFTIVFNALDNKAARAHVNRLCLAAEVPLFESGSAGYKGNVFVIIKGKTECFECLGKPAQKTFPGCTIRNTPSELIHCVVWAKSVFNQLFGEEDPDDAVSPNLEREDGNGQAHGDAENGEKAPAGPSLRTIALQANYDPKDVFNKLYEKDINYLLTMDDLWKDRRPPCPLTWEGNSAAGTHTITNKVWPIQTWEGIFTEAVRALGKSFKEAEAKGNVLVWDKDDDVAMNFVTAAANIRAHIFHIPKKSTFDIKSMAGNIIPAIATTNAIVAGMIVIEALRMIRGGAANDLRAAYTSDKPIASRLVSSSAANAPNPNCFVCGGGNRELRIAVNLESMKVSTFEAFVLKKGLSVIEPDIIDLGTHNVIISSDGDTDGTKTLHEVGVRNGTRFDCDDFKQDFNVKIQIRHDNSLDAFQYEIEEEADEEQKGTAVINESMEIDKEEMSLKNLKRSAAATKPDENVEIPSKRSRIEV